MIEHVDWDGVEDCCGSYIGRPFEFELGAGDVIKGWDIGLKGPFTSFLFLSVLPISAGSSSFVNSSSLPPISRITQSILHFHRFLGMRVGGRRKLIIPPNLGSAILKWDAPKVFNSLVYFLVLDIPLERKPWYPPFRFLTCRYGKAGSPPQIPPNATLIFEVGLFFCSSSLNSVPLDSWLCGLGTTSLNGTKLSVQRAPIALAETPLHCELYCLLNVKRRTSRYVTSPQGPGDTKEETSSTWTRKRPRQDRIKHGETVSSSGPLRARKQAAQLDAL